MLWRNRERKASIKQPAARAGGLRPPVNIKKFTKNKVSGGEFRQWAGGNTRVMPLDDGGMPDYGSGLKFLFETVSRFFPMASAGVWTWKNLCSTRQSVKYLGGEEKDREAAKQIIARLDEQIAPFKFVKGGGMDLLLSQFFHYLFTYGRFAGNLRLSRDLSEVEGFEIMNPFRVKFSREKREPYTSKDGISFTRANEKTFFFYAMDMSWENPYGSALLEAAWSLMGMADDMLTDMSRSSANAGVPRLHIKIDQPVKLDEEDDEIYIDRSNAYFDSYMQQFADIAPDDNFYSWNDLSIGVVGGHPGASGFVWRMNRQIIDEEIIAAFHLFPWIIGKSASTTKNWVRSQFDLIMSQTETIQKIGKRFAEWIRNTELRLKGITNVRVHQKFEPVRDPARKDMAIAERFEISNIESKVKDRFISVDDGARELGYDKAYDAKNFPFGKAGEEVNPAHREDKNDEVLEGMEEIKEAIDNLTHKEDEEHAGNNPTAYSGG